MPRLSDSDRAAAAAESLPSFDPVAATLREEVLAHYRKSDMSLEGRAGWNTLETNSGFAERRGIPLVTMATRRLGVPSLAGLRLLDLGCGFGALAVFFAFQGARVTAIDLNSGRLEVGRRVAARHRLAVELASGSMGDLRLPERSFEVAVMNNSLCYLAEPEAQLVALREARRVLVPGGVLVIRNPNRLHPIDQFTGLPLLSQLPPDTAVWVAARLGRRRSRCRLTSPHTARRNLLAAGFVEPADEPAGNARWTHPPLLARYSHFTAVRASAEGV